jgi:hypothetical protein
MENGADLFTKPAARAFFWTHRENFTHGFHLLSPFKKSQAKTCGYRNAMRHALCSMRYAFLQ